MTWGCFSGLVAMPSAVSRACLALAAALFLLAIIETCPAQVSFRLDDMQGDAERLEQALQRRGSLHAVELPVRDFADRLSRQFGVPIELDVKKLEEAGVEVDSPINTRLESIPLVAILEHGLREVELTFTIRASVILITTPEEAESRLTTKIYPVRDLVYGPISDGDYDSLIEVITTTIAPQSWDEVGGPGSIGVFDNASSLVISQTDEIHRAVEPLLVKLRQVKNFQGIPSEILSHDSATKNRSHRRIAGRPAAAAPMRLTGAVTQAWQRPQVDAGE
jgi:hypothetical protein